MRATTRFVLLVLGISVPNALAIYALGFAVGAGYISHARAVSTANLIGFATGGVVIGALLRRPRRYGA